MKWGADFKTAYIQTYILLVVIEYSGYHVPAVRHKETKKSV